MSTSARELGSVCYPVDDVGAAVDSYGGVLGFQVGFDARPAIAELVRGSLRLLVSSPVSSAARPMPDGRVLAPGGGNRIHLLVDDIDAEVAKLQAAGVPFRNEVLDGPVGRQVLVEDPCGNPVELFQPAG